MEYKTLYELYYKNSDSGTEEYLKRFNSSFAKHLQIKIHEFNHKNEYELFYNNTSETADLQEQIMSGFVSFLTVLNNVPGAAISQFLSSSLITEVKSSNDIEGVRSTRKEIKNALLSQEQSKSLRLWGIVNKYTKIINDEEIPLFTCENIRNLYDDFILSEITRENPQNAPDGNLFRAGSVDIITGSQKTIHRGIYTEEKIISYMNAALAILHDSSIPMLFRIAIFHYLFGYIHPFYDGNGRMSRFITSYLLSRKLHPTVALQLSWLIKRNKNKYYKLFELTSSEKNRGDITPFIISSLKLALYSISTTENILHKKLNTYEKLNAVLSKLPFRDSTLYGLYNILLQAAVFSDIGATVKEISATLNKSPRTIYTKLSNIPQNDILITKDIRPYQYKLSPAFMKKLQEKL